MRHDPEIVNRVLELLRQYGWEVGTRKLQEEIERTPCPEDQQALRLFAGRQEAERGKEEAADLHFADLAQQPEWTGWALFGQAFVRYRRGGQAHWQRSRELLAQAASQETTQPDRELKAAIAHLRGSLAYKEGNSKTALDELGHAWHLLGKDHFGSGRILDAFGMVYANLDNFGAASKFFERAIEAKKVHNDQSGLALTYGQLGRLYLSWEDLGRAAACFHEDLRIAEETLDERGKAQMYNHLGQVEWARGEEESSANNVIEAQKHWRLAASWLDSCVRAAEATKGWERMAGYARKDRALLNLARGEIEAAEQDVRKAEEWFAGFFEGLAHVQRVQAMLRRKAQDYDEALRLLQRARAHFESNQEQAELARTGWEIARTLQLRKEPSPRIAAAYLEALAAAEKSRRAKLVQRIERQLREIDAEALAKHVYRRARGRAVEQDTTSLVDGQRSHATVLYFDLQGSTPYAARNDPAELMRTLNQLMSNLAGVLRDRNAQISGYRGDGFLAIFEGENHARRAVTASLELFRELDEFNRPNRILELEPLVGRIGISTGEVVFGNVGTYDKMDYSVIGTTANLGARLEANAEPGRPCISRTTHDAVGKDFRYAADSGRSVKCKGLDDQQVWDVIDS